MGTTTIIILTIIIIILIIRIQITTKILVEEARG